MLKILKSDKGYTLIEALICVMIGTIAIASMGFSLANGFWMADENRAHMYALNALRKEVENVRGMDYDAVVALGGTSTFTDTGGPLSKLPSSTGTRIIQNSFGDDIKKITFRVSWTARSGRTLTESLTTYVSRVGINRG
ncbi:MAG TPA: prepilin-type N-terminal cleavage/methylation domain-containing protein [Candidatus Omnitrophota bacterium]|nr:prepilin-type N-terminal cleavage/methylation domain-containing protein [Candidatus Omnitrophota bacterium]